MAKIAENLIVFKVSKLVRDTEEDLLSIDDSVVTDVTAALSELLGDGYVVEPIQE